MIYSSRNWKAVQTARDFGGSTFDLTISGEIEVVRTDQTPILTEANPQGKSHNILLVDATVQDSGDIGLDILIWKAAAYTREVQSGQFLQVTFQGVVAMQTIDVEIILS